MSDEPQDKGPIAPIDTLPDGPEEREDLQIGGSGGEWLVDPTIRTYSRGDPTLPSTITDLTLDDEPLLDLTLESYEAPEPAPVKWVESFTEQTVMEAVAPLKEEAFDWAGRLEQLQRELARARTASERVALLLEIGEVCWDKLDDRARAAKAFEQVQELEPDNRRAFEALDAIYYLEWETEKLAELLIDRAGHVEAPAEQAALLARVADLYEQLNQHDKAVIALEAAHRANPDDVDIAAQLAELTQPPEPTQPKDQLELLAAQLEQVQGPTERIEILERMAGLYQQREQPERMAECLEEVLTLDPRRLACHRRLEQHYQQTGQLGPLLDVLQRHVDVAPPEERASIQHRMAKLYEGPAGDPQRAREAYRAILALAPGHGHALVAVVRLSEQLGDWVAAAQAIEALIEREANPAARAELLHRLAAIQLDQLREPESGEGNLVRALEVSPTHARSLARLGEIYRARADWGKLVRLLTQAEAASPSPLEKARLLYAAGVAALEGLDDEPRAAELLERTLEVDPDHDGAARPLSEIYWRQGRHEENVPVLELLLRRASPDEPRVRALFHFRLGAAAEALGRPEQAGKHLRQAVQLDPTHLPSLRALMAVAARQRSWREVWELGRRVLERREDLSRDELSSVLHAMGICLRELGQKEQAIEHLRQALQLDPAHHSAIHALAELQKESSNWEAVVELKRSQLQGASEDDQVKLLREVAELQWRQLKQLEEAERSLRRALEVGPRDHGVLHDLIDLASEMGRWETTVEMCGRMAELETEGRIRAKYYFTIGVIYRDRLDDVERAVDYLNRVLDEDPTQLAAFEAIDKLCTTRRAWKELERSYRKMIKRLPQEGQVPLRVMLWHNLGEVLRSRRRDFESAVAAFEAAAALDPDNLERQRILAELYLSLGGQYAQQGLSTLHALLRREPGRLDHYHTLRRLYMDAGRYDRAWCFCMVLSFLNQADREEEGFYQQYRRGPLRQASSALADDIWQRFVHHPDQNPYLSAIFALVTPALASMTARPPAHYNLKPKERRDPSRNDLLCLQIFDYATAVMVVTRADLYLRPDRPEALLMAHTQNTPTFVAGAPLLQSTAERELAFIIAKQLTYLRPEHFLRNALPSRGQLQTVLLAVLSLCQAEFQLPEAHAKAVAPIAERIQRSLQPGPKEQLVTLVRRFVSGGPVQDEANIGRWWNALDLTSDRVGFLLCGDLELAAAMIHADSAGSELSTKDRVNQLIRFATSEAYLNLRDRMGLSIEG